MKYRVTAAEAQRQSLDQEAQLRGTIAALGFDPTKPPSRRARRSFLAYAEMVRRGLVVALEPSDATARAQLADHIAALPEALEAVAAIVRQEADRHGEVAAMRPAGRRGPKKDLHTPIFVTHWCEAAEAAIGCRPRGREAGEVPIEAEGDALRAAAALAIIRLTEADPEGWRDVITMLDKVTKLKGRRVSDLIEEAAPGYFWRRERRRIDRGERGVLDLFLR